MTQPDFSSAQWCKSSVSGDGGCVEVAYADGMIGLRDSKSRGAGPVLIFNQREWTAFLAGATVGEFNLDELAK